MIENERLEKYLYFTCSLFDIVELGHKIKRKLSACLKQSKTCEIAIFEIEILRL